MAFIYLKPEGTGSPAYELERAYDRPAQQEREGTRRPNQKSLSKGMVVSNIQFDLYRTGVIEHVNDDGTYIVFWSTFPGSFGTYRAEELQPWHS